VNRCKKECFARVPEDVRDTVFATFYRDFETKNSQDAHLAGLIVVREIQRRRPRKTAVNPTTGVVESVSPNKSSFTYYIRKDGLRIKVNFVH
jgi:hypothetical protein